MAKPDMRKKADSVNEMVKQLEANVKGVQSQIDKLPASWQQLISSQEQLNKLIDSEKGKRKGLLGSFKKGLGLQTDENQLREANENLAQAIYANDDAAKEVAEEKIAAIKKQAKLNEEIYEDFKSLFPGIISSIEKAESAQEAWNRVTEANFYVKLAAVLLAITAALVMIFKRVNSIKEEFGLTNKEAVFLNGQMILTNLLMKKNGISAEQISESFKALTSTFGEASTAAYRFAGQMSLVARNAGITAENATEMVSLFQAIHGVTKEVALDMITSTKEMAALTGLSPGVIIREMAEHADSFASHIGKSEQNLMAAVAQAKKLGMEFNSLESFGDGLLDITERINKEQMLSAMLGKQVSFEQAAMLNAQGRSAEYMIEMSKQLEGVENLSAVERRLFAGQMDMAVADMMKLRGLQSGMATKTAAIPGQNPYEQARYKQGERMLRKIDYPAYQND